MGFSLMVIYIYNYFYTTVNDVKTSAHLSVKGQIDGFLSLGIKLECTYFSSVWNTSVIFHMVGTIMSF